MLQADNEPDMRKISLFLTVAGPEAQEVYGTFTYVTDESPKTYADVMNKFIDCCMPKKNLVYERFVFKTSNQNQINDRQLTVMSPSCARKLKAVNMMDLRIHSLETGLWWEQIQLSYKIRI